MSPRRLICLLLMAGFVLSASPGRTTAIVEVSPAEVTPVERAGARLRAAIAAAEALADVHHAARAEWEQLRIVFERTSERLARVASELAETRAIRDATRRNILARREIVAAGALEQLRRGRKDTDTHDTTPMSAQGVSRLAALHLLTSSSSEELRERTSRLLSEITTLSSLVDELRSQLAQSEARVQTSRSELQEAAFWAEEAERRHVAARSRLERGTRSAEAGDETELTRLPPTMASLRSYSGDETSPEPRLRLPLRGAIAQRFGERRGGQRSRGLVLSADRPQPVLAPGTGVVAYAGPFRDIGLLLIIEHRNAYHSLVIGASRLEVRAGDVVTEGQAVGWMGRGPSGNMDLYLELRRFGEPVDPMPVLSAQEGEVER